MSAVRGAPRPPVDEARAAAVMEPWKTYAERRGLPDARKVRARPPSRPKRKVTPRSKPGPSSKPGRGACPYNWGAVQRHRQCAALLAELERELGRENAAKRLELCGRGGFLTTDRGLGAYAPSLVLDRPRSAGGCPIRRVWHCDHRACRNCARRRAHSRRDLLKPAMDSLFSSRQPLFLTLTQRGRIGEPLAGAGGRFLDALGRFTQDPLWRHHVKGAVIAIEVTWSTPDSRTAKKSRTVVKLSERGARFALEEALANIAANEAQGEWWHVHAHVLLDVAPCARRWCVQCIRPAGTWVGKKELPGVELERARELVRLASEVRDVERACHDEGDAAHRADLRRTARELRELGPEGTETEMRGPWLWQAAILDRWRAAINTPDDEKNGGANIQRARSTDEGCDEVLKYIAKGIEAVDLLPRERTKELLAWIRGRKLLRTYGSLRGIELDEEADELAEETPPLETPDALVGYDEETDEAVARKDARWSRARGVEQRAFAFLADAWAVGDLPEQRGPAPPVERRAELEELRAAALAELAAAAAMPSRVAAREAAAVAFAKLDDAERRLEPFRFARVRATAHGDAMVAALHDELNLELFTWEG